MALYFSVGACIPRCDFAQLLHIEDLMQHYSLHKEEAKELGEDFNLFSFLKEHFVDMEEHDHDSDSDHEDLPFKSISVTTITLIQASSDVMDQHELISKHESVLFWSPDALLSSYSNSIFHPPITSLG